MPKKVLALAIMAALAASASCSDRNKNLGTAKNPVKISFMPSKSKKVIEENAPVITEQLAKICGLSIQPVIASSYISIIDGLGTKKADGAFINSLGYLLARDWSGAKAVMQVKGVDNLLDYKSAIITNAASGIKKAEDLNGKNIAYTDPYSMAGYLVPLAFLTENKIIPSSSVFVGSYDEVVSLVYNGKVDAGAIFYHKPDPYGRINDARFPLIEEHNDLLDKVNIVAVIGTPIPNTPVVIRKELPPDVENKLTEGFAKLGGVPEAIAALNKMYDATGFAPANEEAFNGIRKILNELHKQVEEVVPGALTFYKKHIWQAVPEY